MKGNKIRDTPKIKIYIKYELEEIMDIDDNGYDFCEESTILEEVEIEFERE